ncbi:hypothetical protein [Chryseobacterium sp. G0186]|uniref:hypothetical protein n=1 Tax=Chryseobacterium sp. G0186 TaxID=2487064 RepID=UPI0013DE72C7|nr:hypothetical protein [Chryseobacterium sp. G0186]
MLLGLAFPNDNVNTTTDNDQSPGTIITYSTVPPADDGGPVGGETEQTPPPRK